MAHHIRVKEIPHRNKNGSESETKKDYQITDRSRGKTVHVGVATSKKGVQPMIDEYRKKVFQDHLVNNPNDRAFINKHKVGEDENV